MNIERFTTVLLATDFSEPCRLAESRARELAESFGATLVIVHGIEPIRGVDEDASDEYDDFYSQLLQRAEAEMERRAAACGEANLLVKQHIRIGPRWRVVLEVAEEESVDLIVIGRRAPMDASEFPTGTTAHKVYYGSPRPVLFVPLEA